MSTPEHDGFGRPAYWSAGARGVTIPEALAVLVELQRAAGDVVVIADRIVRARAAGVPYHIPRELEDAIAELRDALGELRPHA